MIETYSVQRRPGFAEVTVTGVVTVPLLVSALDDLVALGDFHTLNVLWNFTDEARPPAFHELDTLVAEIRRRYAGRDSAKKVALVVPSSFGRSVAALFQAAARVLPVTFRVFGDRDEAVRWLDS